MPDGDRGRVARTSLAWGLAVLFGINSLNSDAIFAWLPLILSPGRGTYLWIGFLGVAPSIFPLVITLLNLRTRSMRPVHSVNSAR